MTIKQTERFYKQDMKEYEIKKNKEFLKWMKEIINNGYHCFINIDELQELINNIVNWYEIKYPERELEYYEGIKYTNFQDIKSIASIMDTRQLLFRLPNKQLSLIKCGYRAKGWGQRPIYESGKEVGWKTLIFMRINNKNIEEDDYLSKELPYFLLCAEHTTGKVIKDYDSEEYLDNLDDITLDELLLVFNKKYADKLDFTELKESIYDHQKDIELRKRILELTALKLLYSENTVPQRGYIRAQNFINEFNKELNLTLSTEQIDKIMHRAYAKEKGKIFIKR